MTIRRRLSPRTPRLAPLPVLLVAALAGATATTAQEWSRSDDQGWCRQGRSEADYCEVRELTLSPGGRLSIDAGANGGVRVRGGDVSAVRVRAKVQAWERENRPVEETVERLSIEAAGGEITTRGPGSGAWSVSFEVEVPRSYDLSLVANNGGLSVEGVEGRLELETRNGGISLASVAGDVVGRTANGGLSVELAGDRWEGEGLDLETRNGGVDLRIPEAYSAELETGTVNGRLVFDFPVTMQGELSRGVRTTLGAGGAPLRVVTTNGSVDVGRP